MADPSRNRDRIIDALEKGQCYLLEVRGVDGVGGPGPASVPVVAILPVGPGRLGQDRWALVAMDESDNYWIVWPTRSDLSFVYLREYLGPEPKTVSEALATGRADRLQVGGFGFSTRDVTRVQQLPSGVCPEGTAMYVVSWMRDEWFYSNAICVNDGGEDEWSVEDPHCDHNLGFPYLKLKPLTAADPKPEPVSKDVVRQFMDDMLQRLDRIESQLRSTSGGSPLTY